MHDIAECLPQRQMRVPVTTELGNTSVQCWVNTHPVKNREKYGGGQHVVSFGHVDDLVNAVIVTHMLQTGLNPATLHLTD